MTDKQRQSRKFSFQPSRSKYAKCYKEHLKPVPKGFEKVEGNSVEEMISFLLSYGRVPLVYSRIKGFRTHTLVWGFPFKETWQELVKDMSELGDLVPGGTQTATASGTGYVLSAYYMPERGYDLSKLEDGEYKLKNGFFTEETLIRPFEPGDNRFYKAQTGATDEEWGL